MFLFGSSCGLSPVFKGSCWPAPLLVTVGTRSSLEMDWSFDWVGDVHMCFEESGKALIQCEMSLSREQQGQEGVLLYACSVRCVTVLTPCAGAESGLRGKAVAQQTMTSALFLNC